MRPCYRHCTPTLAVLALLLATVPAQAQRDDADATRLTNALHLRPGMTVLEVGAGNGTLALAVARVVGESGHVYASEIDARQRGAIERAAAAATLANITVVEGRPADANVADGCCDAVFMRNVYHHFDDPAAMNASLFRAMKPGALLAIIDFPPRGGDEAQHAAERDAGGAHGVGPRSVEAELRGAGFELVETDEPGAGRWFMVVARKPAAP